LILITEQSIKKREPQRHMGNAVAVADLCHSFGPGD
jgi:hypothetical protein